MSEEAIREAYRVASLWKRYRLRQSDWDRIFEEQGFACKACRTTKPKRKKPWHVDHDHKCCPGRRSCGRCVRGILCFGCNLAMGYADDSIERLEMLAQYLRDN